MTHFPDLTPYAYDPSPDPAYNVGWLDPSTPFPTGPTSTAFHEMLLAYCRLQYVVRLYRGGHTCPFCAKPEAIVQVQSDGERISLGNGEIRVIGTDVVYAAPTLIYHYVVDHGYQPPQEFVGAVLAGPGPGSAEHQILVSMVEGEFRRPALPPEVDRRLRNRGGQASQALPAEQLSRLLEGAQAGGSLSLDELAQVLRGYGTRLEADTVSLLVARTSLRRQRADRALKRSFEDYEFGMIIALDELVQIQQDGLLDQGVAPRRREAVAGGIIDDLRQGKWNLPAPLPVTLKAYAEALGAAGYK
ncbi:MAG: hypothetical protein PVG56_15665 [Anaerolineae bacterium]|jgi:hypothetical protein